MRNYPSHGPQVLEACMPTAATHDQTFKIFDIVPGLEDFKYDISTGVMHFSAW